MAKDKSALPEAFNKVFEVAGGGVADGWADWSHFDQDISDQPIVVESQRVKEIRKDSRGKLMDYAETAMKSVGRFREADACGAGSPGGAGFEKGNTCAKSSGASQATKKKPAARWSVDGIGYLTWDGSDAIEVGRPGNARDVSKYYKVTKEETGELFWMQFVQSRPKDIWRLVDPSRTSTDGTFVNYAVVATGEAASHPLLDVIHSGKLKSHIKKMSAPMSDEERATLKSAIEAKLQAAAAGAAGSYKDMMNAWIYTGDESLPDYMEGVDIDNAKEARGRYDQEVRAFHSELRETLEVMGPNALRSIAQVGSIKSHATCRETTQVLGQPYPAVKVNGYFSHYNKMEGSIFGVSLEWGGGDDSGYTTTSNRKQVIAHEMGHVIDGPEYVYSKSKEWMQVWESEIGNSKTNPAAFIKNKSGNWEWRKGQRADSLSPGDKVWYKDKYRTVRSVDKKTVKTSSGLAIDVAETLFEDLPDPQMFYAEAPLAKYGAELAPDPPLTRYAMTAPYEGFAEFASLLVKDRAAAEARLPKAFALWKKWKLVN